MSLLDFGPIYTESGNITQIEYAKKCASSGSTILGMVFENGILLATENPIHSPLYIDDGIPRIQKITDSIMMAWTGMETDGKVIYENIKEKMYDEWQSFDSDVLPGFYKNKLSRYIHSFTARMGCRPVGCDIISAVKHDNEFYLIGTECDSTSTYYKACAYGKGSQRAKTELEKLDFEVFSLQQAIDNSVRILYKSFDPLKDKAFNIQISFISSENNYQIQEVSKAEIDICVERYKDLSIDE